MPESDPAAIERLKSRYQLLSTVLGTSLVSVVGAWLVFAEKAEWNAQDFDAGHREFVTKFVEIAIDEDIERRQRFARYFATVTLDAEQRQLWANYADYVDGLIAESPSRILALSEEREAADPARQAEIDREIDLLRRQLGAFGADVQLPSSDLCIEDNAGFPARWLCIAEGEARLKVAEIPGPDANARILDYARFTETAYADDDIPWNGPAWVVAQAGVAEAALPSALLSAQSWLEFGEPLETPEPGALAVFGRPSGIGGTVGFFLREEDDRIVVLAGNIRDRVTEARLSKSVLLGFRTFR